MQRSWAWVFSCLCLLAASCSLQPAAKEAARSHLDLYDLSGALHRLSDYRGKVVIAQFWSSWCVMCKTSFPSLLQLQKEIGADRLAVVSVGIDDSKEELKKAAERIGVPFPVLLDSAGTARKFYKVSTVPTGIVFDPRGLQVAVPDPDNGESVMQVVGPRWWYKDSMIAAITRMLG